MTDAAAADHPAPDRPSSRRALLGAGVIGTALALAGSRSASATGLSTDDSALVAFAIGAELAARDLYDEAIAAGADDDLWALLRQQHAAYAQRLSGIAGISADTRNDELFTRARSGFASGDPSEAALQLENVAAATHTALLGGVTATTVATAIASIVVMESRHAAVIAGSSGGDLDAVLLNPASPLSPEASS